MNAPDKGSVLARFREAIHNRNYISFEELASKLNVTESQLIALKKDFEDEMRREDRDTALTSRVDLSPPGFEVHD